MTTHQNLPVIQPIADYEIHLFTRIHRVPVFQGQDGFLYASLQALCQVFGLDESAESQRIQKHEVLKNHIGITSATDETQHLCLRLGFVGVWLLTLPIDAVRQETSKQELITFQENTALILEELFCEGRLTEWPLLVDLLNEDEFATQAYRQAVAVLGLARDQLLYSATRQPPPCE